MLRSAFLALLVSAVPAPALTVFIGTGGGEAKGIYRTNFDPESGALENPVLAAEYPAPGFLALHPEKPVLYAVGRPEKPTPDGFGTLAAFTIGEDDALTFFGESSSAGKNPCHLAVDAAGRTVAIANYSDGSISTVRLGEDGSPEKPVSVIRNEGRGPNERRQEGPYAHGVYFDSANARLFVPDLGLDQVLVYRFDAGSSEISAAEPLATAPGAGPRHMAFSPDERHAYVINELDNTVLVASHQDGKFETIQTAGTLPSDFTGENTTAEIEVHPDGRFVYASNRGHDSIVVFRRDPESGRLELVQHAPCAGKTPRHFKIAPGGRWLLCAHQNSHTISSHPLDPETGKLGAAVSTVEAPNPICILFRGGN